MLTEIPYYVPKQGHHELCVISLPLNFYRNFSENARI